MDEQQGDTQYGSTPGDTSGNETDGNGNGRPIDGGQTRAGRASADQMVNQLQGMIDSFARQAGPVFREVAAKAAELAVVAGEKAGPIAHRAADVTEEVGIKVAARGKEVAADLRRGGEAQHATDADLGDEPMTGGNGTPNTGPGDETPGSSELG